MAPARMMVLYGFFTFASLQASVGADKRSGKQTTVGNRRCGLTLRFEWSKVGNYIQHSALSCRGSRIRLSDEIVLKDLRAETKEAASRWNARAKQGFSAYASRNRFFDQVKDGTFQPLPDRSVRMSTLKTGGGPVSIGWLMCGSGVIYPQTTREVSLHPLVQPPSRRPNLPFAVDLTARILDAVADRVLCEHLTRCNGYVLEESPWLLSESTFPLSSAFSRPRAPAGLSI